MHLKTKVVAAKATKQGIECSFEGASLPAANTYDRVLVAVGALVVLGAVILRQIDFGGGPPPTYRSTWNVGLSSLMVLGAAFWFNHLLSKDDLD